MTVTTFMRSAVRRTAVGLGALALAAGAAACGGDEQEPAPEDPGVEEPAEEHDDTEPSDGGGEQPAQEPSDGGGMFDGDEGTEEGGDADEGDDTGEGEDAGAAGELSSADIDAATERFVEFIQAVNDHDAETACSIMLNPETGQTGAEDPECVEIFEEDVAPAMPTGALEHLDASMIEAEDNGDGMVTIILEGQPFPMPMGQGDDGTWYLTGAV